MGKFTDWFFGFEEKSDPQPLTRATEAEIDQRISEDDSGGYVSVLYACARVIAEGLALPPISVQRITSRGREYVDGHPVNRLLSAKPNKLQTPYEFREVKGWQAALHGDAYSWINRSRSGEILELVPLNITEVSRIDPVKIGDLPSFTMAGRAMKPNEIWHFRGPANRRQGGLATIIEARRSIALAAVAEAFGTDLFKNRAALEGIISIDGTIDRVQLDALRETFERRQTGAGKRGRTAFFPAPIKYQALSATATDAQWIEARRYQIEEICRFFRVSPTKVFNSLGSQSYASVEQAHIAHDQDTDAHWHTRFMQSATLALLTEEERAAGYRVIIDNRDYLRGTANERATYYQLGISAGWMTRNEAREAEGYAKSNDPTADQLTPAANLFGDRADKPAA